MKPKFYRPKDLRINERIRIPKLRLVDSDGKQLGVVSREEALRKAAEKGLDLVELVPNIYPPVCKIMDYGKYKYEQSKSEKHKHRVMQTKEIKLGLETQEADIRVKLKHAEKFLTRGDKVRIRLKFRGREIMYAGRGKELIWNFAKSLDSISTIEQTPTIDGRIATALLAPKRSKDAKVKDK